MMNVFRSIDRTAYHVDFLCFSREGMAYEDEIMESGSDVFVLPRRREGLKYYHCLEVFFRKHRYDVVHWCTCSCSTVAPLYYAWKHHVPMRITHSHNSSCTGLHNRLLHYMLRPVLNWLTTERLACSTKAGEWLFGKQKFLIVKNGIDMEKFSYSKEVRQTVRKELNIPDNEKVIGHVGRFNAVKNHSFIVDVFAYYVRQVPDTMLMLIGIGETQNSVVAKIRQLHLEEKVLLLGERTDVPQFLQAMDLFVMPSLFEGLPFVLVEAQAAGLPCVVSDTVDPQVKITPNVEFLSLSRPTSEWAEAISRILKNFRRVKTDQSVIDNGFSIERTVKKLETLYSGTE